ncbi:hypothetical protein F2Q68_00040048 [Brassica cretica]|uniref:Uncharacterized protein n=1 Tax=Brassica cretica TaxID=69181 RepID=A0A8S9MRF6_BRACR|nr:hypothetical protein F2Q68_00040048 [Brassica cretica]
MLEFFPGLSSRNCVPDSLINNLEAIRWSQQLVVEDPVIPFSLNVVDYSLDCDIWSEFFVAC